MTNEQMAAVREVTGELSSSVARSIFIGHAALPPGSPREYFQDIWDCAIEAMRAFIAEIYAEVGGDHPVTVLITQDVATDDARTEYRRLCLEGGVHLRTPAALH